MKEKKTRRKIVIGARESCGKIFAHVINRQTVFVCVGIFGGLRPVFLSISTILANHLMESMVHTRSVFDVPNGESERERAIEKRLQSIEPLIRTVCMCPFAINVEVTNVYVEASIQHEMT